MRIAHFLLCMCVYTTHRYNLGHTKIPKADSYHLNRPALHKLHHEHPILLTKIALKLASSVSIQTIISTSISPGTYPEPRTVRSKVTECVSCTRQWAPLNGSRPHHPISSLRKNSPRWVKYGFVHAVYHINFASKRSKNASCKKVRHLKLGSHSRFATSILALQKYFSE